MIEIYLSTVVEEKIWYAKTNINIMNEISILKANGESELFDENKLLNSIKRAGIPTSLHQQALSSIKAILYPGIPTSEIYSKILDFLEQSTYPYGRLRYSLKKAIMDLGPTGFPFEKYIGAILAKQGFEVVIDQTIEGKCVTHEVDIIAKKYKKQIIIECKFHNRLGSRTDIKVALYVYARFQDILEGADMGNNSFLHSELWFVTNTKCSSEVIRYALCRRFKVVSWGYPEMGNLQNLVEKDKLYPITCLTSLSSSQKEFLLRQDVVLTKTVLEKVNILDFLKLSKDEKDRVLAEVNNLA